MDFLLNITASGLVLGAMYGLIAMAFSVIYKTTGVVNFAQGEMMMLTAYIAWSLGMTLALPFWLMLPLVCVIAALIGALVEYAIIRPMMGEPPFAIIMATMGLAIAIRSLTILIWGVNAEGFDASVKGGLFEIGPVVLFSEQIFALAVFLLVSVGIWAFMRFTRVGTAMRATALDESAALLMGINVRRIHSLAWAISSIIAALAGVCFALAFSRSPSMWFLGLQSFPASILGGLDAPLGSALGGLLVGVSANLSEGYIGQGLKEISGFVIIILVLMIRPYGLFGRRDLERV